MSPTVHDLRELAHTSAAGAENLVTAFHSAHSPDPRTGGYVICAEYYTPDNWQHGGEPIDGREQILIDNATSDHDEAWRICRWLADSAIAAGHRAAVS